MAANLRRFGADMIRCILISGGNHEREAKRGQADIDGNQGHAWFHPSQIFWGRLRSGWFSQAGSGMAEESVAQPHLGRIYRGEGP